MVQRLQSRGIRVVDGIIPLQRLLGNNQNIAKLVVAPTGRHLVQLPQTQTKGRQGDEQHQPPAGVPSSSLSHGPTTSVVSGRMSPAGCPSTTTGQRVFGGV